MIANSSRSSDGRKRRWEEHNSARRQAIIEAALAVLTRTVEPGAEMKVQQIADEASIHRTVVYRHFQDRADLDSALQEEICSRLRDTLIESATQKGAPRVLIRQFVDALTGWVVEHPSWMRFAERELSVANVSPLDEVIGRLAEQIQLVILGFFFAVGGELTDAERELITPWIFGLITGSMAAIRNWSTRTNFFTDADALAAVLAETIWLQIVGLASARGLRVPESSLEQLRERPDSSIDRDAV